MAPVSEHLHIAVMQVRWYNFQFLMQQLAEELSEIVEAMSYLLLHMPGTKLELQ